MLNRQPIRIDSISMNHVESRATLGLIMPELGLWVSEVLQARLRRRLNEYVTVIKGGELERAYPQTAGAGVRIALSYAAPPNIEAYAILDRIAVQLGRLGIGFSGTFLDG